MNPQNKQDLINAGYGGYAGWGDTEAIADFRATGGGGKRTASSPSSSSSSNSGFNVGNFNPIETAKQIQQFNVEANKPVVTALEQSKEPLKQRYDSILSSLKSSKESQVNRQTIATRNELAGRGIYGGGFADQEMTNAINPIEGNYQNLVAQTGAAQGADLSNIAIQQAQAQAGNPSNAISSALSISQLQNQLAQQSIENQMAQKQLENQTLKTQYDIKAPYFKPESNNASAEDSILEKIFGSGVKSSTSTSPQTPDYFTPAKTTSQSNQKFSYYG